MGNRYKNKKLLFHTLTAHGRNSGDVFARNFSNRPNSNQSSLGFFVTGETYVGKHGVSLKLKGIEKGINDLAESRAIVMHGADYVSESYVKKFGRLGRSFGCPAVPMNEYQKIIPVLAGGTCLFIYYPDPDYLSKSDYQLVSVVPRLGPNITPKAFSKVITPASTNARTRRETTELL